MIRTTIRTYGRGGQKAANTNNTKRSAANHMASGRDTSEPLEQAARRLLREIEERHAATSFPHADQPSRACPRRFNSILGSVGK